MADERLMERAISLAQQWPYTHPNPRVGAVVTDATGEVLGEGWHRGPGTDHAEIVALAQAGDAARGSTVYVTLEPCAHHGRTPPCANALIAAGVSTVVVGIKDPDANVSGEGIGLLERAGIEVVTGVAGESAREVDPAYFHHRETGMPLVTLKWAMTLDGAVAAGDGTSQWITGAEARKDAHEIRSRVDGVVIGAGTLRADDPLLDVRIEGFDGVQPRPIVIAGHGDLPAQARIWKRDPVIVATSPVEVPTGTVVEVASDGGVPDPVETCQRVAELGMLHLLVEGGPTLAGSWWRAGVVTDGLVYIGAKLGAGMGRSPMAGVFATITEAHDLEFGSLRNVGDDVVITFRKKQ